MDKCVYQLRLSTDNMPFYVGKGSQERPKQHFFPYSRKSRSHKNNVINKAMREGVEILIEYIFTGLTDQEALETERTIIALYGRQTLTNATDGGEGVSGNTGYYRTQEMLRMMSEARSGEKHYLYGKHHSEETKSRMSLAHKGVKKTDSHKSNISKGHSKTWLVYFPDGHEEIVHSLNNFCKDHNLNACSMQATSKYGIASYGIKSYKGYRCVSYSAENDKCLEV